MQQRWPVQHLYTLNFPSLHHHPLLLHTGGSQDVLCPFFFLFTLCLNCLMPCVLLHSTYAWSSYVWESAQVYLLGFCWKLECYYLKVLMLSGFCLLITPIIRVMSLLPWFELWPCFSNSCIVWWGLDRWVTWVFLLEVYLINLRGFESDIWERCLPPG